MGDWSKTVHSCQGAKSIPGQNRPLHVSLLAIPDAVVSTLTGIYDVLGSFRMLGPVDPSLPADPPFNVEIVSTHRGSVALASGVPVEARRSTADIDATDIIIVPSVLLGPEGWKMAGIRSWWIGRAMHARAGALL